MPITQDFLDQAATVAFTNAGDINDYFVNSYGSDFITWFNANVGGEQYWGPMPGHSAINIATDPATNARFESLWAEETIATALGTGSISLLQFIALQCIVNNETGGSLGPVTERVGVKAHPGIAYAFDSIPGLKSAYNTLPGNKNCLELFSDEGYNNAFGQYALADTLMNTTDTVWSGTSFPQADVPTSTNPVLTGYLLEADFFKFRGRGFIQTTGRANYKEIISFITSYSGTNGCVLNTQQNWQQWSEDTDVLATISSNAEWDDLFQNSDLLIPAKGIALHNAAGGNYLGNIDGTAPDTAKNTIRKVGRTISGSNTYADLYINRVIQLIEQL